MFPSVSVVIPTYNSESFLEDTLHSVFTQTRLPDEIVIVDDCSRDGTVALIEKSIHTSPVPLRCIKLSHNTGSPVEPMNVGIENCKSTLVALLDHDDLMLPDKLALQADCFRQRPDLDMVFGDYTLFDGTSESEAVCLETRKELEAVGQKIGLFYFVPSLVMTQMQLVDCRLAMSCSNFMFKKCVWAENNQFDSQFPIICDFTFKLKIMSKGVVGYLPRVLFRKRVHSSNFADSQSIWKRRREIDDVCLAIVQSNSLLLKDCWFCNRLQQMLIGQGWYHRRQRRYLESLHYYWDCFSILGFSRDLLQHLLKFPFAVMFDAIRSPCKPSESA